MPKNNEEVKSKMRSKSTRKPLRDVSNAKNAVKPAICKKTSEEEEVKNDSLDRLLLIHSDLSSILRQIDEVVLQAVQVSSKEGMKEIKQFSDVLSKMQTSLKPWVPKFKNLVSSQSIGTENKPEQPAAGTVVCIPEEDTQVVKESPERLRWESRVSPSPLVSWRAECKTEGGRQLFLLTPMHRTKTFSSKFRASSIQESENIKPEELYQPVSLFDSVRNLSEDLPEDESSKQPLLNVDVNKIFGNFENECEPSGMNGSMSPPKFCILLEPVSEFSRKKNPRVHKSTPFPVRAQNDSELFHSESSSGSQTSSDDLHLKYPELFGIKLAEITQNKINALEESPNWNMSPLLTCAIMEPPDEKSLSNLTGRFPLPKTTSVDNQPAGSSNMCGIVESTPMMKDPASSFRMGKHAGENTLKKELWTRFEAATTHGSMRFNHVAVQKTHPKRFIDQLDEAYDAR